MRIQLNTRLWITAILTLAAVVAIIPTVTSEDGWWSKNISDRKLALGLDLKGGMELLLQVDTQGAVDANLDSLATSLKGRMKDERIRYESVEVKDGEVVADLILPKGREELTALIGREFAGLTLTQEGDTRVRLAHTPEEATQIKKMAVIQSTETIRNRIDQFGVAEPTIVQQGEDRILVQLPGIKDPDRAIKLIKQAAVLKFMLVDEAGTVDSPGPGNVVLYGTESDGSGRATRVPYVLKSRVLLRGDTIRDARSSPGDMGSFVVNIEFNGAGARTFEQVTGEHVKERMAIVLDETVYSAPVIQERIGGGRAQISGRFTPQEAADLAIVLRAGSLPAPVKIIQKWTVSPTLGEDSIRKGLASMVVGFALIVVFMVIYYGVSGLFAITSLFLNLLLIPACLALFSATLTLPGMAGIVLALGMAVDANVLIYERIREELRAGKTVRGAVDAGFARAFLTILDANLTTIIAAVVLFQFGTGSIKGFAVVLTIGLVASMFTSVFVTRAIFDWYLRVRPVEKLSV